MTTDERQLAAYARDSLRVVVKANTLEAVDAALKTLKNTGKKTGLFSELKRRATYEKPSEARRRKRERAQKRQRKSAAKQRAPLDWRDRASL